MIDLIVQARMGSTRLPGKVMKIIKGKTVLEHIFDRVKHCKKINRLIIATSNLPRDDKIVELCTNYNIIYFRGDEEDVLDRYYQTAKFYGSKIVGRFTSDCPLIDPYIIDKTIDYFNMNNLEYTRFRNDLGEYDGFNIELITFDLLENAWKNNKDKLDREHVTPSIRKKYNNYFIINMHEKYKNIDFSKLHLSLDTQEDLILITDIINNVTSYHFEDVLDYLNKSQS